MAEYLIPIGVITVLIIINGFFVAAEFALAGAPRTRVAQMAEGGSKQAQRILSVLRDPKAINRYLSTAQVGITLASLGLGMYGEHAVAEWFLSPLEHVDWITIALAHTLATIISVALLTYLHVVLGEMVPKSLALQSAAQTVVRLAPLMAIAELIFRPLTYVLNKIGDLVLRVLRIPPVDAEARLISTEELAYIFEESSEGGLLDAQEQLYLENVLDFQERTVSQVMISRTRMDSIPAETSLSDALEVVVSQPHSRYPVYRGDRDDIVGVLYAKDLASYLAEHDFELTNAEGVEPTVADLAREAVFVPKTLLLDDMLMQMRQEHFQVAVVVDEYGGTAGLLTLEDLVEELIGEFQDEFDEEIAPMATVDAQTIRVRGDVILDEMAQHYDVVLTADSAAETVGGFVMEHLGHVAQPGERFRYGDMEFEVEETEGRAVKTVLVHLPPSDAGNEDATSPADPQSPD